MPSVLWNCKSGMRFFSCCRSGDFDSAYFPQKLLPQIGKLTRVKKSNLFLRSMTSLEKDDASGEHLPPNWTPSSIRKMNAQIKSLKSNIELCYLGEKQYFGEIHVHVHTPFKTVHVR